ncbi:CapA family protein [Candidatus Gottesmanbacteria bacterium]|nr:CapA family protein [Candidatus Gottesmanbacteria bacterium]
MTFLIIKFPNLTKLSIPTQLNQQLKTNTQIPATTNLVWSLVITGDVIPSRVTNLKMVERNDFSWPFVNIAGILKDADLTLINLESPLLANCPVTNEGFTFCTDARFRETLKDAGVDVANLANNHTLNYGWEGLGETEEHLDAVGIETTGYTATSSFWESRLPKNSQDRRVTLESNPGSDQDDVDPGQTRMTKEGEFQPNNTNACEKDIYCSKLVIKQIDICEINRLRNLTQNRAIAQNCDNDGMTIKVGFLGYNAVGQRIDRVTVQKQIKQANKLSDILIVSVHWGKEYVREPQADLSLAPDDPKELGKLLVDWGADIVVGNHPHWIQGMEWYKDKPIFYALGNTIFDQEWSEETKRGVLVKLFFRGKELLKEQTKFISIGIRDYGQAYVLEGEEKQIIENLILNQTP